MNSRILVAISLVFGTLLFSRTFAISSEVSEAVKHKQKLHKQDTHADDTHKAGSHDADDGHATTKTVQHKKQTSSHVDNSCLSGELLMTVSADMDRLQLRKLDILERESALKSLQDTLAAQTKLLEESHKSLDAKIATIKAVASEDIAHLVRMYETMKPKQASEIFNSMDAGFASGFLREMNSERAGLILAGMETQKSYEISYIMASRNADYRDP